MQTLRCSRFLVLLLLLFPALVWASSRHSQLIVFGDSLTDTGNIYLATGGLIPPDPPYYQGRLSNGPLWVEYIAPRLKLKDDIVINHAWAGAKTGRDNVFDNPPENPSVTFPGLLDAVDMFSASLGGAAADPEALYLLWSGSNDLLDLPDDPLAAIQQGVSNIITAIQQLKMLGAKKFAVVNVPDLGLTPVARATQTSSDFTALSYAFNLHLQQALHSVDPSIVTIDVFSILRLVSAEAEEYDLTNVTDSCLNTATGICSNPDEYMFWDHVHPTTRGHAILSRFFRKCLVRYKKCFANKGYQHKRSKRCSCSFNDDD